MFELKDLPSRETLGAFAKRYHNPDIDGLQLWLMWASSTNEMLSAFDASLASHGLTQAKFFVLLLLLRNSAGLSIAALAEGVNVTSPTMTRIIDRMEAASLCARTQDPMDRRAWIVRIAKEGESIMERAMPSHYAWVAELMAHFNDEERAHIRHLMSKLSVITQTLNASPLEV